MPPKPTIKKPSMIPTKPGRGPWQDDKGEWHYPPKGNVQAKEKTAKGGRTKRNRKASAAFLSAGTAWRSHLTQFRKTHPNMSLRQQMKAASKTYKKGAKVSGAPKGRKKKKGRRTKKR